MNNPIRVRTLMLTPCCGVGPDVPAGVFLMPTGHFVLRFEELPLAEDARLDDDDLETIQAACAKVGFEVAPLAEWPTEALIDCCEDILNYAGPEGGDWSGFVDADIADLIQALQERQTPHADGYLELVRDRRPGLIAL